MSENQETSKTKQALSGLGEGAKIFGQSAWGLLVIGIKGGAGLIGKGIEKLDKKINPKSPETDTK